MALQRSLRLQRGSALLLAMVIVALITTLAGGMIWQQWRAIQVESAERARAQSAWILFGAHDWSRLILREDARADQRGGNERPPHDHLGEPWATPLAEARLSTFLATDRDNTQDSGPEAFLSGDIADAQARYNLNNLLADDGKVTPKQLAILRRLCETAALPSRTAERIAEGLAASRRPAAAARDAPDQPLPPQRLAQLAWLGVAPSAITTLEPLIDLLPGRTPINLNTASREVIAAVLDLDLGSAERVVQQRQRQPYSTLAAAAAQMPTGTELAPTDVAVTSSHFRVRGQMRLDQRVLEESALVQRRVNAGSVEVVTLARERRQTLAGGE